MKKTPIRRTAQLARRRRREPGTAEQRFNFKRETLIRSNGCPVRDDGDHRGDLEAHHVIPKQAIRRWARDHDVDAAGYAAALWDPANGLAVCGRHHDRHTRATRRLPVSAIPTTARSFAVALELDYLLDRHYRKETDE